MPQNTIILQNQNNTWTILSPSEWSDLKVSNHYITNELSKISNNVFYVESPGVIGFKFKRILQILLNLLKVKLRFRNVKITSSKVCKEKYNLNFSIIRKAQFPLIGLPFLDRFIFEIQIDNIQLIQ